MSNDQQPRKRKCVRKLVCQLTFLFKIIQMHKNQQFSNSKLSQ